MATKGEHPYLLNVVTFWGGTHLHRAWEGPCYGLEPMATWPGMERPAQSQCSRTQGAMTVSV